MTRLQPHRRQWLQMSAALAAGSALTPARAQSGWPAKPLRIVVPFAAGGAADAAARVVAQHLTNSLGKTVVVDNRGGADGAIAGQEVARSAPDGYTIFLATASPLSYVPSARRNPPYDPVADFTPITRFCTFTFFLIVHPSLPVTTLPELITYARANPGKLSYATGNTTSIVATAQLMQSAGIDMVHVPYKGEAQALLDFATGRVQVMFATPAVTNPLEKDGKLRALCTLLPTRSALMPNVPTITEAGQPLVNISPWGAFVGPAKMPADIVERLAGELQVIMKRPEFIEQMDKYGLPLVPSTPQQAGAFIKEQQVAWNKTMREAKIALD